MKQNYFKITVFLISIFFIKQGFSQVQPSETVFKMGDCISKNSSHWVTKVKNERLVKELEYNYESDFKIKSIQNCIYQPLEITYNGIKYQISSFKLIIQGNKKAPYELAVTGNTIPKDENVDKILTDNETVIIYIEEIMSNGKYFPGIALKIN